MFQGWKPLQHPLNGLEVMSLCKRLMQGNEPHDFDIYIEAKLASSTPHTQIFIEINLIVLRVAATNSWELRDLEPMLHFLET